MRILSLVYEKDREKEYMHHSKVALQAADNVLQWNIVDGLLQNLEPEQVRIINSVPVGNYPKSNRKIVFHDEERQYRDARLQNIGFINLPFLKPLIRFRAYIKELKQHQADNKVLLYGLYLPQLLALRKVKRKSQLDVCLIIDDLPAQFGIVSGSCLKVFLQTLVGKWTLSLLNDPKIIDRFVLLTEHMKETLDLKGRPYCVMEGIANPTPLEPPEHQDKRIVYYAGTLNEKFGIVTLLDAFARIPGEEYELWICGDGDARDKVETAARQDPRVRYFGFVSKPDADRLRNSATVLVNPRSNEGAYTRYSFPSKTIEYLLAEKPVVMYKLDGIPDEYDAWLHYFLDNSPEGMAKVLQQVCDNDVNKSVEHARLARAWVLAQKNPTIQVKRILELYDR